MKHWVMRVMRVIRGITNWAKERKECEQVNSLWAATTHTRLRFHCRGIHEGEGEKEREREREREREKRRTDTHRERER